MCIYSCNKCPRFILMYYNSQNMLIIELKFLFMYNVNLINSVITATYGNNKVSIYFFLSQFTGKHCELGMDLERTNKVVIVSVAVVTVVVKAAGAAAAAVVVVVDAFVVVVVVVIVVIVYNSIATMCLKDSIDRNHFIIFPDLCLDGFVVHKKLCYYMKSTLTCSWGAARSLCQNMGADLVVIKSEEESQFVNNLMSKGGIFTWRVVYREKYVVCFWKFSFFSKYLKCYLLIS